MTTSLFERRFSDVPSEPVQWAWADHVVAGGLTVIGGDYGVGKSLLTYDLAARWSAHLKMPDGSPNPFDGPVTVAILSAADGPAAVMPRLLAHGADPDRIMFPELGGGRTASLTGRRLHMLAEQLEARYARILVLDPLLAYLPGNALAALMPLVHRLSLGMVGTQHLPAGTPEVAARRICGQRGRLTFVMDGGQLIAVKNCLGLLAEPLPFQLSGNQLSWGKPKP